MAELKDIINTLDKAADAFDHIATAEQEKLYEDILLLAKQLDTDTQGKVKQSIANLKRLTQIRAKLAALSKDKDWTAGIAEFSKYFGLLQKQQNAYFSQHFPEHTLTETAKQKHNLMKQMAVQNTVEALMGDGLKANVTDKLNDILLRAVTGGAKFKDLQEELRAHMLGADGGQGALARYANTYAVTALSQFTGQNNKLLTDDLDTEWFMYTGSNIETTREFCQHLTEKKYIHKSEIPQIIKGKINDYQCAIYAKTGLPYGMIAGTTPENFQINCGGWNCRHQLVPVADAVVPKDLRDKFNSKTAEEIEQEKAEEEKKQKIAELKAKLAQYEQWKDTDTSGIASAVASGDVNALEQYVGNMHAIEQQLSKLALLANPKDAMQQFSISELQAVQEAVAAKLAQFDAKGFTGQKLVEKLKFEVDWVQQNKKYPTWQVAQQAYNKKLEEVQADIALKAMQQDVMQLMTFKTKSPQYKAMLSELTQAYSDGNVAKAQQLVSQMNAEIDRLMKRRKPKASSTFTTNFADDAYSQTRKDAAIWAKDTKDADTELRNVCGNVWKNASDEEKDAIYGYTSSYCNIQEPLRGLTYYGSEQSIQQGLKRIPQITNIINKSSYNFDIWLQRGDDRIALKKFGLTNYNYATDEEIKGLVGKTGTEPAFWSAGVAKGKGFNHKPIIFNIYAPKGTKMMYCEPFSVYGGGSGRYWNGVSSQQSFGNESEILIQRGTTYRITKVTKGKNGVFYIDLDIISQNPLPFPYKDGYPYQY